MNSSEAAVSSGATGSAVEALNTSSLARLINANFDQCNVNAISGGGILKWPLCAGE